MQLIHPRLDDPVILFHLLLDLLLLSLQLEQQLPLLAEFLELLLSEVGWQGFAVVQLGLVTVDRHSGLFLVE